MPIYLGFEYSVNPTGNRWRWAVYSAPGASLPVAKEQLNGVRREAEDAAKGEIRRLSAAQGDVDI